MESLIQTPEKTEELPSQNTKELSPKSISRISNNLRNDAAIPDQAIFDASAQLLGALNPKAKALFNKILADPLNLTEAIAYLHDLEGSEPILTHKDFFKIHDNTEISNKKLLEMAQTFREFFVLLCIRRRLHRSQDKKYNLLLLSFAIDERPTLQSTCRTALCIVRGSRVPFTLY